MLSWLLPLLSGFLLTLIFTPMLIAYFRAKNEGQTILEEGPKWHKAKSGTPTMGGLAFVLAISITCLIYGYYIYGFKILSFHSELLSVLFVFVLYSLVGLWDDSIKIFKHRNEGFKAWQKFLVQVIGALIFASAYYVNNVPFVIRFSYHNVIFMSVFYFLFIIFWLVGFSNAVNLTDGLDGLVSGLCIIAFSAYGVIAIYQAQLGVLIFCMAVIGALLAFLLFNRKPAKIFMGDMGSLALGGSLAAVSILLHHELSLLWIGIVFVGETLSVIIQVLSFKLTGKRIFKMTPIHHHFELMGWSEWKVDIVFWLVGLFTAITGVLAILM